MSITPKLSIPSLVFATGLAVAGAGASALSEHLRKRNEDKQQRIQAVIDTLKTFGDYCAEAQKSHDQIVAKHEQNVQRFASAFPGEDVSNVWSNVDTDKLSKRIEGLKAFLLDSTKEELPEDVWEQKVTVLEDGKFFTDSLISYLESAVESNALKLDVWVKDKAVIDEQRKYLSELFTNFRKNRRKVLEVIPYSEAGEFNTGFYDAFYEYQAFMDATSEGKLFADGETPEDLSSFIALGSVPERSLVLANEKIPEELRLKWEPRS